MGIGGAGEARAGEMDDVPFYGSGEGDAGTAAEVADDLAGWLKLIGLEDYLGCFVDEGYEVIGDVMVLARAGTEAIEELIGICNRKVAGGKLSKHRFKHAFKIDVADYYDTHKNPDNPERVLEQRRSSMTSVGSQDLAFLLCNDPDVQQQLSIRRSSRRGKKTAGGLSSAKTPGVAKVLEEDENGMCHTIERVPSKSFKRLSQVEPPAAAAAAASGIEPVAETTAATAAPPSARSPRPAKSVAKSPRKAGMNGKGISRATGGTSWVVSHSKAKGKPGAKNPAEKEMSFAEMKASLLASKSTLDTKGVSAVPPKDSTIKSDTGKP